MALFCQIERAGQPMLFFLKLSHQGKVTAMCASRMGFFYHTRKKIIIPSTAPGCAPASLLPEHRRTDLRPLYAGSCLIHGPPYLMGVRISRKKCHFKSNKA